MSTKFEGRPRSCAVCGSTSAHGAWYRDRSTATAYCSDCAPPIGVISYSPLPSGPIAYASAKGFRDGYRAGIANVVWGERFVDGNRVGTDDTYHLAFAEGYREGQLDAIWSKGLGVDLVQSEPDELN